MLVTTTLFMQMTRFLGHEISYNRILSLAKNFRSSKYVSSRRNSFWSIDKNELWDYLNHNSPYKQLLNRKRINSIEELYERTMQYLGEEDGDRAIHTKAWRMASYNPNYPRKKS